MGFKRLRQQILIVNIPMWAGLAFSPSVRVIYVLVKHYDSLHNESQEEDVIPAISKSKVQSIPSS